MLGFLELAGWALELGAAALTVCMAHALYREGEARRLPRVLVPGTLLLGCWLAVLVADFPHRPLVLAAGELAALAVGLLFFLPLGRLAAEAIPPETPRIDERDIMFARAGYREGTPEYRDYYARNPDRREGDDRIRSLPGLCSAGSSTYDPLAAGVAGSTFRFLGDIRPLAEGTAAPEKQAIEAAGITATLKGLARYHGAKLAGIAELKPYHFYSHRGRHPENYGDEVTSGDRYGIVFAVEMDYFMVKGAPKPQVVVESARQYLEAAKIGMALAYFIRGLGYSARNHMDGNYLVCAPLVAHDAGLGEIGRMGIIITPDYGPRVRLGVVTTDLPLVADGPSAFGVQEACAACRKCADNCPSRAIPAGDKAKHDGVRKWKIDQERCYEFWCRVGTDCAVCMNACPYSKPDTFVHRLFRSSLRNSPFSRRMMVRLDDYLYGRRPYCGRKPDWL